MPQEPGKPTSAAKSSPGKSSSNVKVLGDEDSSLKKSTSERAQQECEELEEELLALKVTYEQYFLGNERLPPVRAHEDLKKRLNRLKTSMVRNTAAKFRISSLYNKFLTYERLWQRTLQEIESGTYKRDLFKAKRRSQKSPEGERRKGEAFELTEEISDEELVEVADIIPNEPKPAAAPASQPRFIPRPVEPEPAAVSFRPVAAVPAVPVVPVVPTVAPKVAPVAPAGGTPFRGTPTVAPVVPAVGTPVRGSAAVPPGGAVSKGAATIPPGGTPSKGTPTIPPGGTPSRGTATIPPGGTPSRGTGPVPPGGTPGRGTSGISSPPVRGVPAFGSPSQSTSGIAAALESLADEPLSKPSAPAAQSPSRPPSSVARPGTASSAGSKPGMPAASRPGSSPSSPPKPAGTGGSGGLSDEKLKAVYDAYVTAKRRNQEDTSKMSFESVATNLRKQVPELLKQHGAKSVEFKVVIKDGKATLKAVPK
ncbi:MXAN_5187 C-terminal domain-containing protein [Hyalangium sp.]|uniref:MXAN_5187 C-terminal domain-containing protein n=1 Tax=Hyalangium sp. TaxID=2028555 RepID=UPI002D319451|nr:MXAN_5187 C-terminal domain-containing protein [Hyalangium sp.]HYI01186.1 MXAN_5187 C-terminal domain-containing protein [Hyalangium sp.]